MALPAEIQTGRLKLRPLGAEDGPALVADLNDLAVASWLARVPFPYAAADFRQFLGIAEPGVVWAIEDAEGFAGIVSIEFVKDRQGPPDELGYWLAQRAWGKGYMTEAARAVVGEFLATGASVVASGYFAGNVPSAGVLRKLGFVEVGQDLRDSLSLGPGRAHVSVELTREGFIAALPVEAQSARLSYRSLQTVDFEALHAIGSDWSVVRQLGSWPWPPERAFTAVRARPYTGDGFVWGMFLHGVMIGTVSVTAGVFGYSLLQAHWRQGYGREAATTALNHAFARPGLAQITASVWADNDASCSLLRSLGFVEIKRGTEMSKARRVESSLIDMALNRADWPAPPGSA